MEPRYQDRRDAGRSLVDSLMHLANEEIVVLALPRGGVPVAYEVATRLDAPLDLLLVRKLGVPGHEELAFGAIATGNTLFINEDVTSRLNISSELQDAVISRERAELDRRAHAYRADQPDPDIPGRYVVIIDDGVATGATMRAGLAALRQKQPARLTVAVPVGPPDALDTLAEEADEVVCPARPDGFAAIGQAYIDFAQTPDNEVRELLRRNWTSTAARSHG